MVVRLSGRARVRPRERRRSQLPNALPKMIEERIVSFSIALGVQHGNDRGACLSPLLDLLAHTALDSDDATSTQAISVAPTGEI
jgi:hypothetical protein